MAMKIMFSKGRFPKQNIFFWKISENGGGGGGVRPIPKLGSVLLKDTIPPTPLKCAFNL